MFTCICLATQLSFIAISLAREIRFQLYDEFICSWVLNERREMLPSFIQKEEKILKKKWYIWKYGISYVRGLFTIIPEMGWVVLKRNFWFFFLCFCSLQKKLGSIQEKYFESFSSLLFIIRQHNGNGGVEDHVGCRFQGNRCLELVDSTIQVLQISAKNDWVNQFGP